MSTSIYADGSSDEAGTTLVVGWRCGVGNHRTAFVWRVPPGEMERYHAFTDDRGQAYDRAALMEFVAECDERHEYGCRCERSGHVGAMPERAIHRWYIEESA